MHFDSQNSCEYVTRGDFKNPSSLNKNHVNKIQDTLRNSHKIDLLLSNPKKVTTSLERPSAKELLNTYSQKIIPKKSQSENFDTVDNIYNLLYFGVHKSYPQKKKSKYTNPPCEIVKTRPSSRSPERTEETIQKYTENREDESKLKDSFDTKIKKPLVKTTKYKKLNHCKKRTTIYLNNCNIFDFFEPVEEEIHREIVCIDFKKQRKRSRSRAGRECDEQIASRCPICFRQSIVNTQGQIICENCQTYNKLDPWEEIRAEYHRKRALNKSKGKQNLFRKHFFTKKKKEDSSLDTSIQIKQLESKRRRKEPKKISPKHKNSRTVKFITSIVDRAKHKRNYSTPLNVLDKCCSCSFTPTYKPITLKETKDIQCGRDILEKSCSCSFIKSSSFITSNTYTASVSPSNTKRFDFENLSAIVYNNFPLSIIKSESSLRKKERDFSVLSPNQSQNNISLDSRQSHNRRKKRNSPPRSHHYHNITYSDEPYQHFDEASLNRKLKKDMPEIIRPKCKKDFKSQCKGNAYENCCCAHVKTSINKKNFDKNYQGDSFVEKEDTCCCELKSKDINRNSVSKPNDEQNGSKVMTINPMNCECPDIYKYVFGPTLDETVLVGLSNIRRFIRKKLTETNTEEAAEVEPGPALMKVSKPNKPSRLSTPEANYPIKQASLSPRSTKEAFYRPPRDSVFTVIDSDSNISRVVSSDGIVEDYEERKCVQVYKATPYECVESSVNESFESGSTFTESTYPDSMTDSSFTKNMDISSFNPSEAILDIIDPVKESVDKAISRLGSKKPIITPFIDVSRTIIKKKHDLEQKIKREKNTTPAEVRFAITKILKYDDFTTYEIYKSTKAQPKILPEKTEGIFVLQNGDLSSSGQETNYLNLLE